HDNEYDYCQDESANDGRSEITQDALHLMAPSICVPYPPKKGCVEGFSSKPICRDAQSKISATEVLTDSTFG
ncbi:MAG: hypothetical protein OEM91_13085, partial [Hyphomicrobiales bacterium]|nr:hypothetical protein [Hyphomicrobiales bacterium]